MLLLKLMPGLEIPWGRGYVIRVIVVFSADCLERRMDERAIAPSQPLTAQVLSAD